MSKKILQVNFRYSSSFADADLVQANSEVARQIANVPGLRWKIWTKNQEDGVSGAVYLFDDEASLQSYLAQVIPMLRSIPVVSDIQAKPFDVVDELTAITRGPV